MLKLMNFQFLRTVLIVFGLTLSSFQVLAENPRLVKPTSRDFKRLITEAQKVCSNLRCERSPLTIKKPGNILADKLKRELYPTAEMLAQIWADTVLEGDIELRSGVWVDDVELIFKTKEILLGYRITYSAKAINWAQCPEEGVSRACEGRVVESAFISGDGKSVFHDRFNYASFQR